MATQFDHYGFFISMLHANNMYVGYTSAKNSITSLESEEWLNTVCILSGGSALNLANVWLWFQQRKLKGELPGEIHVLTTLAPLDQEL